MRHQRDCNVARRQRRWQSFAANRPRGLRHQGLSLSARPRREGRVVNALRESIESIELRPPRRHGIGREIAHISVAIAVHFFGHGLVRIAPCNEGRDGGALAFGAERCGEHGFGERRQLRRIQIGVTQRLRTRAIGRDGGVSPRRAGSGRDQYGGRLQKMSAVSRRWRRFAHRDFRVGGNLPDALSDRTPGAVPLGSLRYTTPFRITNRTRCVASISCDGSPSVAMRSAA